MSDDEIEYLGRAPSTSQGALRPLTGLALNVEKSTNSDAYRLVFDRAGVIQIGRRPSTELSSARHKADSGSNSAMFRCAVVSRKHAKIAFSDMGHAYIIDLNSHHGTHLRRTGSLNSMMLVPETPTLLSDGDVVTFGKPVGRNDEFVQPIVVRIELLRNPKAHLQPAIKPLFVPSPGSATSSSSSSLADVTAGASLKARSPSSGRYGIYASSGSSDEMLDNDSEIEEITPPHQTQTQPRLQEATSFREDEAPTAGSFSSSAAKVFNVLRRNMPLTPPTPPSLEMIKKILVQAATSGGSSSRLAPIDPLNSSVNLPSLREAIPQYKSRSHSPMDLESPASVADADEPPTVVGAWPPPVTLPPLPRAETVWNDPSLEATAAAIDEILAMPAPGVAGDAEKEDPIHEATDDFVQHGESEDPVEDHDDDEERGFNEDEESDCDLNVDFHPDGCVFVPSIPSYLEDDGQNAAGSLESEDEEEEEAISSSREGSPARSSFTVRGDLANMRGQIGRLQDDVTKLHSHRRKYRSRFNTNVRTISDRMTEFDGRIIDIAKKHSDLAAQVESCLANKLDLAMLVQEKADRQEAEQLLREWVSELLNAQLAERVGKVEGLVEGKIQEERNVRAGAVEKVEERLEEMRVSLDELHEKVGGLVDGDDIDLGARLEGVEEEVVVLKARVDDVELDAEEKEDVRVEGESKVEVVAGLVEEAKRGVEKLQGLIEEVKRLRQVAHEQMDLALKDIREVTEKTKARLQVDTVHDSLGASTQTTLKRKRDDEDEDGDYPNHEPQTCTLATQESPDNPVSIVSEYSGHDGEPMMEPEDDIDNPKALEVQHRPKKRLRRIASAMAQTATAVSIGAVVTWTALAFA